EAPVEKYTLKADDGKTQIEETVEIDTEKKTETFEIPSDGDTSPSAPGDVKIVYDFKQKTTHSPTQATFRYTIVGNLNDRSILSDEMANMCAKYPIHLIRKQSPLSAELEKKEQIKREYNRSQICRLNIECNESLTKNQIWILSPKMPYKVFYK
ncbi:hypothetical protein P5673_007721, partial [Acropora cervicornis]